MTRTINFDAGADDYMACTEFAAAYKREHDDAIIKYGVVEGDEHCWVYDPELDRTLDATLSQWAGFKAGCEQDDWWTGDEHPVAEETDEFHDLEAFAEGPGGSKLLEA
jgi:hypothetical protein